MNVPVEPALNPIELFTICTSGFKKIESCHRILANVNPTIEAPALMIYG